MVYKNFTIKYIKRVLKFIFQMLLIQLKNYDSYLHSDWMNFSLIVGQKNPFIQNRIL